MASERIQRQIERLLDEADQAISKYDWEALREAAQAVLRFDPENSDALAYLAAAERDTGSSQPAQTGPAPSPVPAPTGTHPTSFANGRYQVKQSLGEGGKKKVYLAHDTLLDREVAFALIKTEGLDEAGRSRIQREAQAMGRLGSHQHIVTVFDLGQEIDWPYMVTELMGGGDVESLIEKAPDHKIPLERAIDIAKEVSRGLQFAHGRGIVHRDLKPGNVWLTSDGVGKIGDFGLAVALDRSRLTTEGMMVGTVSYMPPEQAMGGEVTPRSDLYSLGAMLYEMVTGRPPFLGDDAVAIIGQHINTPPVAPTWHNSDCPRALDALILRLLAKDPSERPQSASDVLSALEAIDLTEIPPDPPLQRGSGGISDHHALDSLAGGVFVGRQKEMGELKACLEDALSGRGRLATLVGEPGIGKSRTAQELATYAGLRGAQVLWGRCYEGEGAPPYWPWVQAIRSYVRDKEPEELRAEMGAGAEDIAEVVSDVRERLPGLRSPPQLEPEQARFRLFDSITVFLKSASRRQPIVLVLDDLHWADHPSLLLLEFVARELSGSRLLLIGTYRDMDLSRRHPLSLTLGELTRERLFQRVLLRGLGQEDVGRFIELVSGIAPVRGMVEAVYQQTEGNPLFVTEVVRLLAQEGELSKENAGQRDTWSVRIPEGVREVIGRRLDRLSERCNETLTIASVIGREFTLEHLRPLIEDMTEDRMLEVLEEALTARVIEELPHAVGEYQFTHALIQETLSEELSTTRKVRLHARIAESLEVIYGSDAHAHAAELAHRFAEAQTVLGAEKLVHYSLLAGERSLAGYAWEEAHVHFERALTARGMELTGSDPARDAEEAALLFGFGRALADTLERQQVPRAAAILGRAFDYYYQSGDAERAIAVAEYSLPTTPGQGGVNQLIPRALSLAPAESLQAAKLLSTHGEILGVNEGDYEEAQRALEHSLAIARREGDQVLEIRTLGNAARVAGMHLRDRESLQYSLEALELAGAVDELRAKVDASYWASWISYVILGDFDAAASHARTALNDAAKLGDRYRLGNAVWVNEIGFRLKGEWSAARALSDRCLRIVGGDPRPHLTRALLEFEVGAFDQGNDHLEALKAGMRVAPKLPVWSFAAVSTGIALSDRISGNPADFDLVEEAAEVLLLAPTALPIFTHLARTALALVSVQKGDPDLARVQYSALRSTPGMVVPGIMDEGRLLGLLAHIMGDLDKAATHFEDALAFCRKAGYRPELAWTCCDYADGLLERNSEGDRAKAMSLLDESLAISSELGMRPLMERVLSRRQILGA